MADNLLTFEFDKALLPVNENVANQFDNYDEKSFMNISDCETPWWNAQATVSHFICVVFANLCN